MFRETPGSRPDSAFDGGSDSRPLNRVPAPEMASARILIVDDEPANVVLLQRLLQKVGYEQVRGITDPRAVAEAFSTGTPDLMLLDLRMPHIDGYSLLEQFSGEGAGGGFLPIIVLTADESLEAMERALSAGASDFLHKPFRPFEILLRIRNQLRTRQLYRDLRDANARLEERLVDRVHALERSQREMLERLAQAVEARDGETGEHTRRVGDNAGRLAEAMGLSAETVDLIQRSAPLHDVGKIGISDRLLVKEGPLTDEEREVMKTHTLIGGRMLAKGDSELMRMAERIALCHHERWDGTGYPKGLAGTDIPLEARIVAIVDVFDALSHDRPYRPAFTLEQVREEIRRARGRQFDPDVCDLFLELEANEVLVA